MKSNHSNKFAGIIPARYASSRFPGKPLAMIGSKTMIQRVYEQVRKVMESVYVATDDERIFNKVMSFGGNAVMTSPDHFSGTDRCSEAADKIISETGQKIDIVVNIQGDEPFIRPEQIKLIMNCFNAEGVDLATLIRKVEVQEDIFNPNQPKVIVNTSGDAIYFSRSVIPYVRDADRDEWTRKHAFYKHIGLYAYRTSVLRMITSLPKSPLESAESLEQNRWIENGFRIRTAVTSWESIGIDTPEDLEKAKLILDKFDKIY
ncbi:MAG TPA: 3-deoxy-manno-octulosonate cytidylyltransferase [Bacteroidales bacterium]|nr:3-deoxy-manno-octulosonate cytidylyltransferase [Bacteroidales bacterium]